MNVIGIDVSKEMLVGAALNRSFKVIQTFRIPNTQDELNSFLNVVIQKYPKLLIASEATAEYHRLLALSCLKNNIPFKLLNPIVTKQFTRSTVRKRKTDLTDAVIIAKLALTGEGPMITQKDMDTTKAYSRTGAKLARIKRQLGLMRQRFNSIAPEDDLALESLDKCINQLDESMVSFKKLAVGKADPKKIKLLQSIPGIGVDISTVLSAEIEDVSKFKSGKALVAFAGLDPKVKQSGKGLKHNTKLTKRGSPYLRQALYQAAFVARVHDQELKAYYDKKIGEGKKYKEATVATARKLLYRVYAVLKRQTPYTT